MTLKDILLGGGGLLAVLLTLIQFAPVRVNPWSAIARALGKALCADMAAQISRLDGHVTQLEKTLEEHIAISDQRAAIECRVRILSFGDEVLHGKRHSKDSFDQVLTDITTYELYCDAHKDFHNNITVLTSQRIKALYEERLSKNDFE